MRRRPKPNLIREFTNLVDTFWFESECDKVVHGGAKDRCKAIYSTTKKFCDTCFAYVLLKWAKRLALGEPDARRTKGKFRPERASQIN